MENLRGEGEIVSLNLKVILITISSFIYLFLSQHVSCFIFADEVFKPRSAFVAVSVQFVILYVLKIFSFVSPLFIFYFYFFLYIHIFIYILRYDESTKNKCSF